MNFKFTCNRNISRNKTRLPLFTICDWIYFRLHNLILVVRTVGVIAKIQLSSRHRLRRSLRFRRAHSLANGLLGCMCELGSSMWTLKMKKKKNDFSALSIHRFNRTFFIGIVDSRKIVKILNVYRCLHNFLEIRAGRDQHILQIEQCKFSLGCHTTFYQFASRFVHSKTSRNVNGSIGHDSLSVNHNPIKCLIYNIYYCIFYVYGATGCGAFFVETNLRIIAAILDYLDVNACDVDFWIKFKSIEIVVPFELNTYTWFFPTLSTLSGYLYRTRTLPSRCLSCIKRTIR